MAPQLSARDSPTLRVTHRFARSLAGVSVGAVRKENLTPTYPQAHSGVPNASRAGAYLSRFENGSYRGRLLRARVLLHKCVMVSPRVVDSEYSGADR